MVGSWYATQYSCAWFVPNHGLYTNNPAYDLERLCQQLSGVVLPCNTFFAKSVDSPFESGVGAPTPCDLHPAIRTGRKKCSDMTHVHIFSPIHISHLHSFRGRVSLPRFMQGGHRQVSAPWKQVKDGLIEWDGARSIQVCQRRQGWTMTDKIQSVRVQSIPDVVLYIQDRDHLLRLILRMLSCIQQASQSDPCCSHSMSLYVPHKSPVYYILTKLRKAGYVMPENLYYRTEDIARTFVCHNSVRKQDTHTDKMIRGGESFPWLSRKR